jgi:hypothetical protein
MRALSQDQQDDWLWERKHGASGTVLARGGYALFLSLAVVISRL